MKMRYDPSIEHEVLANIGTPPLIKGDENIDFYQDQWDLEQGFIEAIPYAKLRPHTPAWPKIQDSLAVAIQKAILGEATPKEALDEAATEAWSALAEISF
jgi:ABC-type glycerol-3-phosphate transport system substrate-binding protein